MLVKQVVLSEEEILKIEQLREIEKRSFSKMLRLLIQKGLEGVNSNGANIQTS